MKRFLAFFFGVLSSWCLANAQHFSPPTNASSIAGIVVKEPGSEPLKKVLVQVIAENQKEGGNYTASTDADGHFHIENVVPGRYRLFLERTGFVGTNERGFKSDTNIFTIQAGQAVDNLLLRMVPTAVITGRVTDEDGDPMSGVSVIAQKKKPGKSLRENVGAGTTNDLGEYRLSGLFPGQYWIVAIPPPDFRDYELSHRKSQAGTNQDDTQSDAQPDTRYLTTYYPGTYDAVQAAAFTLTAGDEMPANFTIVPTKTYRILGIVTGAPASQKTVVELLSEGGDLVQSSEAGVGADGQFVVTGVGPGSYLLRASAGADLQPFTAHHDINVVAADVEGIRLALLPSFTLSGHLRIEGGTAGDLTQYSVHLGHAHTQDETGSPSFLEFFGINAPVDPLGKLEWKNVNPGDYIVQLFGTRDQNFYLKSATLGGRDITTGFAAHGPATLDLVISTKGGRIEGSVIEKEKDVDTDHPVPNAMVVAVPEEQYRKVPDRFLTGETDQRGHFTIRGIPPGSYTLYAWQDLEEEACRDPDFLKAQETNGTAVKVEEGSDQKVELKLSPVSEEWR
jgi:hypothetical protein